MNTLRVKKKNLHSILQSINPDRPSPKKSNRYGQKHFDTEQPPVQRSRGKQLVHHYLEQSPYVKDQYKQSGKMFELIRASWQQKNIKEKQNKHKFSLREQSKSIQRRSFEMRRNKEPKSVKTIEPRAIRSLQSRRMRSIERLRSKQSMQEMTIKNSNRYSLESNNVVQNKIKRIHLLMEEKNYSFALQLLKSSQSELYLTAVCHMHLNQYNVALSLLQRQYPQTTEIILRTCECYMHLKQYSACFNPLQKLMKEGCLQAFVIKAKILYANASYEQAKNILKMIEKDFECAIALGYCCQALRQWQKACDYFIKGKQIAQNNKNNNGKNKVNKQVIVFDKIEENIEILCQIKLGGCYKQMGLYLKALHFFNQCIKGQILEQNNKIKVLYSIAYCEYKLQNQQNALLQIQQIISLNEQRSYDATILGTIILIKQRNFYEANHLLQRNTYIRNDPFKTFCQSVIFLMKKRYSDALCLLQQVRPLITNPNKNEFLQYLNSIFHTYVAYGHFSLGQYQICLNELEQQSQIGILPNDQDPLFYNKQLASGLLAFRQTRYQQAINHFYSASAYLNRKDLILLIAITTIRAHFHDPKTTTKDIQAVLNLCFQCSSEQSNGYMAQMCYHRGLYACWQGDLPAAIAYLDQAIDKSQENNARYFHLRGVVYACAQNYKQAVEDSSFCLSVDEAFADAYLLRSRCLQIEGDSPQAFLDLQTYLAMKPNDSNVHTYAGHLLFQNGAFDEALAAYSHSKATFTCDDYLTRSKTYFLLGKFHQAAQDIVLALASANHQDYQFDLTVIRVLEQLFPYSQEQMVFQRANVVECLKKLKIIYHKQQQISQSAKLLKRQFFQMQLQNEKMQSQQKCEKQEILLGRIFKQPQYHIIAACCYVFLQDYPKAIGNFLAAVETKMIAYKEDKQFQQEQIDKKLYISHMYYNISLCFAMQAQCRDAAKYLQLCDISAQSKSYKSYLLLLTAFKNNSASTIIEDLFPLKNKLSKRFPPLLIKIPQRQGVNNKSTASNNVILTLPLRLCIPYPKVEPPQISPQFDVNLIKGVDVEMIEKKPQAPWIRREARNVRFTENIAVYSRLDIEHSEISKRDDQHYREDAHLDDSSEKRNTIERLKLDIGLQEKINRLLKK